MTKFRPFHVILPFIYLLGNDNYSILKLKKNRLTLFRKLKRIYRYIVIENMDINIKYLIINLLSSGTPFGNYMAWFEFVLT